MRDDANGTAKALAFQDIRRVTITGQGYLDMTIVVAFDLTKWRWVGTVEVLPGKEQSAGVYFLGQAHGLKGGEIVRLLVDMHNGWTYLAHNLSQFWIEMQVEVAIEGHGRDNHAISSGVEPFEHLFAAIIALPVRRRDQRQFDAGAFRQLFEFALRGAGDQGL